MDDAQSFSCQGWTSCIGNPDTCCLQWCNWFNGIMIHGTPWIRHELRQKLHVIHKWISFSILMNQWRMEKGWKLVLCCRVWRRSEQLVSSSLLSFIWLFVICLFAMVQHPPNSFKTLLFTPKELGFMNVRFLQNGMRSTHPEPKMVKLLSHNSPLRLTSES